MGGQPHSILIPAGFAIPQSFWSVFVSVRFSTIMSQVILSSKALWRLFWWRVGRGARSAIILFSFVALVLTSTQQVARSWECCQSFVERPRTQHACKCSPSVGLLRSFHFCKAGPISLRSADRLYLCENMKKCRCTFTLKAQIGLQASATAQPSRLQAFAISSSSSTADFASASQGGHRISGVRR